LNPECTKSEAVSYAGCVNSLIGSISSIGSIGNRYKYRPKSIHLIPGPSPEGEGCVFELSLDMKREFFGGGLIFNLNFSSSVSIAKQDFQNIPSG